MPRRALLPSLALLLAALLAVAGWLLLLRDASHVIRVPEAELQQRLSERLPRRWDHRERLSITLDAARLQLVDGAARAGITVDATITARLAGRELRYRGTLHGSSGLRYAPGEASVYLVDPAVDALELPGMATRHRERVRDALNIALAEHFAARPLYTLDARDLRQRAARRAVREVSIGDRELVIVIGL